MFEQKIEFDRREPVIYIPLSWFLNSAIDDELTTVHVGLLLPSFEFWKQISMLFFLQTFIGMLAGSLIHSMIIKKRKISSFLSLALLGYGIFIPSLLAIPFYFIQWFDLRNSVLMIVFGGAFVLQAMRCISAIHGTTTPIAVEKNHFQYCIYFCSVVDFKYDPISGDFLYLDNRLQWARNKLKTLVIGIVQLTFTYSILEVMDYMPFPNIQGGILNWKHLINNMTFAYSWHKCLWTSSTAFQFTVGLITGIQSTDLTVDPLFGSASPSDFWGRRWNNVVHKVLKDSIYRPLIPHCHPALAVIAVFFASGLLHEYVLLIADFGFSRNTNIKPQIWYGLQTVFFLWNALVVIGDYIIGKHPVVQAWSKSLPRVVVSLIVVMTVLPIAHLFCQGMMEILLLKHHKVGYPTLVLVEQ